MKTQILKRITSASFAVAALSFGQAAVAQAPSVTYNPSTGTYATVVAVPAQPTVTMKPLGPSPQPAGENNTDQEPTTTAQLVSGARHVCQALLSNPETARAPVWISPLNGRITLAGTVGSEALKSKVEGIANHAAADTIVVSLLKVQSQ